MHTEASTTVDFIRAGVCLRYTDKRYGHGAPSIFWGMLFTMVEELYTPPKPDLEKKKREAGRIMLYTWKPCERRKNVPATQRFIISSDEELRQSVIRRKVLPLP